MFTMKPQKTDGHFYRYPGCRTTDLRRLNLVRSKHCTWTVTLDSKYIIEAATCAQEEKGKGEDGTFYFYCIGR